MVMLPIKTGITESMVFWQKVKKLMRGHNQFEVLMRHPSRDIYQVVRYSNLEFGRKF